MTEARLMAVWSNLEAARAITTDPAVAALLHEAIGHLQDHINEPLVQDRGIPALQADNLRKLRKC